MALLAVLGALAPMRCSALDDRKQLTQYVQMTLTDRNGLPQNSVDAVAQTTDGYMWFGTQEGLGRFDGLTTTVFDASHNRDFRDAFVKTMASSRDGSLWIGTRSNLTHMQHGAFHTVLSAQSPINTIHEAQDGRIWVGTGRGLYSVDHDVVHFFTAQDGLPSASVQSIVETRDGSLWFGTEKGLFRRKGGKVEAFGAKDGAPGASIQGLAVGQDQSLWIGSTEGLSHWNGKLLQNWPEAMMPPHARISSLLVDHNDHLWIGFEHSGMATLRDGKLERYTVQQGLPNDDVAQLFEDHLGHLWVGLGEGGVLELRDGLFTSFGVQEGLSENMVWSVLQARDGSFWAGTDSKGLDHIFKDGSVQVYGLKEGLPGGTVFALHEGLDGSLWIGTEHGILSHLKDGKIENFRDPAGSEGRLQMIMDAPDGDMWLGYYENDGLVRYHLGTFTHYAIPGLLNTASFAADGSMWLGTDHGGISHVRDGKVLQTLTKQDGLLSDFSQAVYVDKEGVVWAGTSPGGLNRIKNGRITTYSVEQGLANLTVGAIVEDSLGNLWMTCNKGIFRVSKKELNDYAEGRVSSIHSIMYGTADGMRSAECNFGANPSVWRDVENRIWFATTAGLVMIDPAHSETVKSTPLPFVEHVLFNRRPAVFDVGEPIGLGTGDVEIKFTAPDFVAPEQVRFRYRLKGFDQDWVDVGDRREAYYTRIDPGKYQFEVQAGNQNGEWNGYTAVLPLTITPHFWQTTIFQLCCWLSALLLGALMYRIRIRFLVRRNQTLETRVSSRTKELQEALQAAASAHDALHEQATKDGLTRLWNRRAILEILTREVDRARRDSGSVCVLMVDVDHFKRVNDTLGHVAGDCVLEEVAARINGLIRPYDSAGRYGGEEFLVVLPGCTLADGLQRAEEFRYAIANEPTCVDAGSIDVTCSFGVAAESGTSAEHLIISADQALYAAKHAGRNRIQAMLGEATVEVGPLLTEITS
ncbi:diguanylate cyclase [Granulicella tundricola]|uniref:diguanylate cyclase n=1 Tax=Granulicella tundricola (strain ATCC BAA-1859 / DSM 23138 / MP5ACTX9) TaxID=1198114 RepID=E8X5S7_GRATM|nr:diguanylate cyclase [Granulicella tundricola]ADW70811.1 diguanylate cyclase with beta propeller sensor [Granulicella tundricola MP5ACTX9]